MFEDECGTDVPGFVVTVEIIRAVVLAKLHGILLYPPFHLTVFHSDACMRTSRRYNKAIMRYQLALPDQMRSSQNMISSSDFSSSSI
jgi:hypothetical protein